MPYRASNLVIGLLGLFAILALLLVGADLLRHARQGAGWKQRLVGAGLMLLASVGLIPAAVSGCAKKDSVSRPKDQTAGQSAGSRDPDMVPGVESGVEPGDRAARRRANPPKKRPVASDPLPTDPRQRIAAVTAEAQEIIAGKRGGYPFDKAGKARMLAHLDKAKAAVEALAKQGKLGAGEAGLWKADLDAMKAKIRKFRTVDLKGMSCYAPRPMPRDGELALRRMRSRFGFLEKLASAKRLHPKVVHKVLVKIEADVAVLSSPTATVGMKREADKELARKIAKEAPAYIKAVRAKLGVPIPSTAGLEKIPQWAAVVADLQSVGKLIGPAAAKSGELTRAERHQALQAVSRTLEAVSTLRTAGRLTEGEASLLRLEATRLRTEMMRARDRARAARGGSAGKPPPPPAREAFQRMNARLRALQSIAKAGEITKVVLPRVLPAIEADLRILGDPEQIARLPKIERAAARSLHRKAKALVERLEKLPTR